MILKFSKIGVIFFSLFLFITCKKKQPDVTTESVPEVITAPTIAMGRISQLSSTSARFEGYIHSQGSSSIVERGICWNEFLDSTILQQKITSGSGVGRFSVETVNLKPSTVYIVKAYALSANGVTYYSTTSTFGTPTNWLAAGENLQYEITCMRSFNYNMCVGTKSHGVFCLTDQNYPLTGDNWRYIGDGLGNKTISCLVEHDRGLCAGTDAGVFYLSDVNSDWTKISSSITNLTITNLVSFDKNLYALAGGNIYKTLNHDSNWVKLSFTTSIIVDNIWESNLGVLVYDKGTNKLYRLNFDGSLLLLSNLPVSNVIKIKNTYSKLYLGSSQGAYYSEDNGSVWKSFANAPSDVVSDFTLTRNSDLCAACSNEVLLVDTEKPWLKLGTGLPQDNSMITHMESNNGVVYAYLVNGSTKKLYKSR